MTESSPKYLVVGSHSWSRSAFDATISGFPGVWRFTSNPADLEVGALASWSPRYVFFLHWSSLVPQEVTDLFECINFHMTDLPFGRGGSPLQNLIARGYEDTIVTAHRMTNKIDSGPVYGKRSLSLEGTAEEIYARVTLVSAEIIRWIIESHPEPYEQAGEPVVFERRRPSQSVLPQEGDLDSLWDHIRMLDATGYPHAFLDYGAFRIEFREAERCDQKVTAVVSIILKEKNQ